ncbi:MAG TPA: serine/threonine-protein kinase [Enhygromyxa sp.]|nr:serine/threonine-protein kinase [Enhygromyxa sp.]
MAGSPTAAWLPKRPELAPADVSGPRFARAAMESGRPTHGSGRATRPFRFGSEDRPDPDPPLGVGSLIGDRYQILRLLGEGGMGRVYEAQHIVLRRHVALKLLRRDAASEPENLARFRQEALAASRIGAPEIVEVVDFASHPVVGGQQTYMVMELLAGESLEDWMDRNARLDAGLAILAALCDGLAAAHRAAVVHRDIKPANVFLPAADPARSNQARVKILDFGIAKITASGEGFQTRQGALLGTPYYLAPERVMGAELTGAADLYSVGVILYEMLTGNVPFVADSFMGILANHVHTAALDPRQAAPDRPIPAAVAQLCMRLLDKQPSNRPSAEAVAHELRGLLSREPELLVKVEIGPRESTVAGVDTQVIAGTQSLPIAERPTQPPIDQPESPLGARSATGLGHAPAASQTLAMTPSAAVAVPRESAGVGRGLVVGMVGSIAVAAIVVAVWLGVRSDRAEAPVVDDRARAPSETPDEVGSQIVADTPTVQPPPQTQPELEPTATPPPEPEPVEEAPEPKPVVKSERKRRETDERKRDRSDEPATEPAVVPSQPDPPPAKPEPDPELPTIKDDVYD